MATIESFRVDTTHPDAEQMFKDNLKRVIDEGALGPFVTASWPSGDFGKLTAFCWYQSLPAGDDTAQSSMELEEYPTDPTLPFALGMTEPHNHGLADDEQPDRGKG